MHDVLRQTLEPVLRDLASTNAPLPVVHDDDQDNPRAAAAMLRDTHDCGCGVTLPVGGSEQERVVWVTDQVQERVIEQLWAQGSPTNWPVNPTHPLTHPLKATAQVGAVGWQCPHDHHLIAPVRALPAAPAGAGQHGGSPPAVRRGP